MIVPGNIRERSLDLDRAALGYQINRELIDMIAEVKYAMSLAAARFILKDWEDVDVLQVMDRCAIVRQELDILSRLLKLPVNHEIHDDH